MMRDQVIEILKLEHQFLRVPFERYKKTIRANHCVCEGGISAVISRVSNAATDGNVSTDDAVTLLSFLVWRLQELKWNLVEGNRVEQLQAQNYRVRFDHLESAESENMSEWNSTHLNRILVDYMLRMSYYDTAVKLAECKNIQDLVDIDIDTFQEAKIVTDALQNRNVAPALAWCAENKSRLKESKVELELQLRLQEFIELVRDENYLQALNYAGNQLAPWGDLEEVKQATATLAFTKDTSIPRYKVLFETGQWDKLAKQFKHEFFKLHGMTLKPLLNIYLQAGLSALKTPYPYTTCIKYVVAFLHLQPLIQGVTSCQLSTMKCKHKFSRSTVLFFNLCGAFTGEDKDYPLNRTPIFGLMISCTLYVAVHDNRMLF